MSLHSLGLCQASEMLATGTISTRELVDDCLARIEAFDSGIHAWAWLDPEHARRQADRLDDDRRRGRALGRLHGIPVGIKDIIDTALIPTEHGFPLFEGRVPRRNAVLVDRLQEQGAVIMGKTVTAALATFMPGKTANPHNPAHTPGGSSSGSAAAVASYMVPGAVGTQTNGSVIRPAAFCGTVGFKPSYGLISRTGVLRQSPFLDQVGVFARCVEDAALLAEVMMGADPEDASTAGSGGIPPLLSVCRSEPPVTPRFAFLRTGRWGQLEESSRAGLEEVVDALGDRVTEITMGPAFDSAWQALDTVNAAEMATWYGPIHDKGSQFFKPLVEDMMTRGKEIAARDYINAMESRPLLVSILDEYFDEYDAIITPAAPGEAPKGLEATGNPMFSTPWTFCGVPALTLPLLQGESGLPVGVQLVGQFRDDARLLRTARWVMQALDEDE
ncbi:MAG: amidase [Gammaproteobacteria bacterium]|nr:amidase [Gammaproteobacteria bacterium]